MKARTIKCVEKQTQADRRAYLTDDDRSLTIMDAMVNAKTASIRHDLAGAAHRSNNPRFYTGTQFLLHPGYQEQIVVRPHR